MDTFGASNYTMQCLCAPTREEVDRAHMRGAFLDLGMQSLWNIENFNQWKLGRPRVLMWWTIGMTSIPLHLMYDIARRRIRSLTKCDIDTGTTLPYIQRFPLRNML